MNYQASWQATARTIPEEIFSRLELPRSGANAKRALLMGKGADFFVTHPKINEAGWKIFTSGVSALPDKHPNLIPLKGETSRHLKSFPDGIFNLIVSLWDLPLKTEDNISYVKNIRRLLSKQSCFGIITYLDGSPELPLSIIRKIIREKRLGLKIFNSALPDSSGNLRKMMRSAGFGDVRAWQNSIICEYPAPQDLYQDVFSGNESELFANSTPESQQETLKSEFMRELNGHNFPLRVNYGFAGGVGLNP